MPFIPESEIAFVRAVSQLNYTNPFLEERFELERTALGHEFVSEAQPYWSFTSGQRRQRRTNLVKLLDRAKVVAESLREKLVGGASSSDDQLLLYDELALYILFYEQFEEWGNRRTPISGDEGADQKAWAHYSARFDYWLKLPLVQLPSVREKNHLFSLYRQIYRAFFSIYDCVIGQSKPAAKLRSKIWQSIFTHDLRRYRRSFFRTLPQVTTLVTGPSGSGKELVARAIGLSRYIPFDPRQGKFAADPIDSYFAINISAFSKNLVESELFGHAKGAFTDAAASRAGWLEACGEHGSILLDEIGELEPTTQVKLLRVLQNRQYQRLGETKLRDFQGKIIAATNRDLQREIQQGTFREDLYYRLCSDVIETPSLSVQVQDNHDVLSDLVEHLAQRIAPEEQETLAAEVMLWLRNSLPENYPWPGNIRELEQYIRNIMIHGQYVPSSVFSQSCSSRLPPRSEKSNSQAIADQMQTLSLTAEELLQCYCKLAYQQTKSFEKAAKRLQLDRRTVRAKVELANQDQSPGSQQVQ